MGFLKTHLIPVPATHIFFLDSLYGQFGMRLRNGWKKAARLNFIAGGIHLYPCPSPYLLMTTSSLTLQTLLSVNGMSGTGWLHGPNTEREAFGRYLQISWNLSAASLDWSRRNSECREVERRCCWLDRRDQHLSTSKIYANSQSDVNADQVTYDARRLRNRVAQPTNDPTTLNTLTL